MDGHAYELRRVIPLALLLSALCACRDAEPERAYNRDLGEGDVALPPTGSVIMDPEIAKGSAEWHPFRQPESEPAPRTDGGADTRSPESDHAAEPDPIEQEIHAVVADYNALLADGSIDEILDYFVPSRREQLRPVFEKALVVGRKLEMVRNELHRVLPNAVDRVNSAIDAIAADARLSLDIERVEVVSDVEAKGTYRTSFGEDAVRFVTIDDAWYMEAPGLAVSAAIPQEAFDSVVARFDAWISKLKDSQEPPELILQRIEEAAEAARQAARNRSAPSAPPSTGG